MNYYTLQIHYGSDKDNNNKPHIEERKDLNAGTLPENEWLRTIRERLFTTGFHITTAPGTIQFISPFLIHTAYLIKQPQKHNLD